MRNLAATGVLTLMFAALAAPAVADTTPPASMVVPMPLSQVSNPPDRVATARVTDPDGMVIGAVQRVELQNGRPIRLDIALLGSENTVSLDASTVRYDAGSNVVASGQSARQLMARPKR